METLVHFGLSNALAATILAVLVASVAHFCRRPALVHSLWLLVLLRLIMPPVFAVGIPWPNLAATPNTQGIALALTSDHTPEVEWKDLPEVSASLVPGHAAEDLPMASESIAPILSPLAFWKHALLTLWLAGSSVWLVLACWRLHRFGKLLRYAQPAAPSQQERVRRLAGQLGLRRCPSVWFMPATVSPMLCALIGAPRLFIPAVLWDGLSDEQRDTLLIHELAHLRRRDHWVRQLEFVVTAVYWWHPILWWARREIQEAEEQCCDAWVVSLAPAAIPAYAETLVATVAFLSRARPALPLGASGMGHARLLRRRLTMILRGRTPTGLSAAGFAAVVVLGAVALALLPAWTQPTASPVQDEILRGNTIAENAQQQDPDVGAEPLGWRIRHSCMWIRASEAEKKLKELLGVAPAGPPMGDLRNPGMPVPNPGNPAGDAGAQGQKVHVTSDGATNQVFVIGPLNKLAQARRALAEMDVEPKGQPPVETGPRTWKTYRAPAGNAEALAKAIQKLYATSSSVAISAIGKDQIMVSAFPADHAAIKKFIESSKDELVTEQITLNSRTPKRTIDSLNALFGRIGSAPVPTLAANPNENAIVVRGTPEQIKAVKEALKKLDADSTAPADGEQRMKRLEDKLDTLLREVEALRKERKTDAPGDRRQRQ